MSSESGKNFGLGVGNKCVTLAAPNARWHEAYTLEAETIRKALGDLALDIQHIGSTSIPSIKAKPIIDIAVGVRRFDDGLVCIKPMEEIGYCYAGTDLVPDDHIFGRDVEGQTRTHLVHVVELGGANWNHFILFRNKLRADPHIAQAYEALKIDLAAKYANNRAAYTASKKDFIEKVLAVSGD
ncbi:GrpB family protein [Rhizobium sp. ICMP 5592]|jgi:GrpB-like predicted nucleotidyltransferase (UPF0157 family)|uniref:GrpB family protein n=1 Tax=Rhizobium sp. ICMP 5592 TaxID=2292445 RepID=UPI001294A570|nr:GrpB family protein [Rhizobium sp. ICMP 5592]MQB43584.1 GrpB family protein [Rhizobium sp. ICMP 5592]